SQMACLWTLLMITVRPTRSTTRSWWMSWSSTTFSHGSKNANCRTGQTHSGGGPANSTPMTTAAASTGRIRTDTCSKSLPGHTGVAQILEAARTTLTSRMFSQLLPVPDHPALEEEILSWWDERRIFAQLRERNRGGPVWGFIDGPVTANKTLGVHTAWGRTLKDVFQRYKALCGFDQRYQNGFDCQGLWIEVGVERELGLNSKHEIEDYGLAEFARRCRDVVVRSSQALTDGSVRLGQWMDWGNDYFTFSDTNIEYIWRFLRIVH